MGPAIKPLSHHLLLTVAGQTEQTNQHLTGLVETNVKP